MLLVSASLFAQKKRTISFDADTTTRPDVGFYGIGVRDAQPYLVKPSGSSLMFKMESPYIRTFSTGKDLSITLTRNHPTVIFALRDSINFILPSANDTLNKDIKYYIYYLGWRGGTGPNKYIPYDSTCTMTFSDSIYYKPHGHFYSDSLYGKNKTIIYSTKSLKRYGGTFPISLIFNRQFMLQIINNKWYFSLEDLEY